MPRVSIATDKFLQGETLTAAESAALRVLLDAGHIVYKTAAEWVGVTLASNAIGIVTDASPRVFKIGDGTTVWADLPEADKQPINAALTAYANAASATARRALINAVGTALEITTALQGVEADATRISAAYMPETFENVLLELADVSALGTPLPLGTLGRNGTGRPVYGDGVTVPGVAVGETSGGIMRYTGYKIIPGAQFDNTFGVQDLLFQFPVLASEAVNGTIITMRGQIIGTQALGAASALPATGRLGLLTPAGLALAGGALWNKISGVPVPSMATGDAGKPWLVDFNMDFLVNTEAAVLKMSEVVAARPQAYGNQYSAGVVQTASNNGTVSSAAVTSITPAVGFNMNFYLGTEDVNNLGDLAIRWNVEIVITAP